MSASNQTKNDWKLVAVVAMLLVGAVPGAEVACGAEAGSLAEGSLAAWGWDQYGQVSGPNSASGVFTQVVGGSDYSLALRSDGSLVAWGYGDYGQVSGPNGAGDGFTQVAGGNGHSVALRYDGSLAAWGFDSYQQVTGPNDAGGGFTQVAGGFSHNLALLQVTKEVGRPRAWGSDTHGQVSGPNGASGFFKQVAGGGYHSLALRGDGSLAAWGPDDSGPQDYGQVTGPNGAGDGFTQVAGGLCHSLALRSDGSLAAWGRDDYTEVSGPNGADGFYIWVGCGKFSSFAIEARQHYDDLLVRDAYYFTNMDTTLQREVIVNGNVTIEAPLTMANSPTMSVGGSTTVAHGGVLNLNNNWTLNTPSLTVEAFGQVNAAGVVDTRLCAYGGSTVAATADLVLGDGSLQAFTLDGQLDVGSHTVLLNKQGFTNIGSVATLGGGTLEAPNGLTLGLASYLIGTGVVDGRIAAGFGSTIEATGSLTLGDSNSYSGFTSDGELYTNAHEVIINDRNMAVLGSLTEIGDATGPGTLNSPNGTLLDSGKDLAGYGVVHGDFTNDGAVHGEGPAPADALEFTGTVDGGGDFTGNVVFSQTYSPGHSPAQVSLENVTFGTTATLQIDLEGTTPGNEYDQLRVSGTADLGGASLDLEFTGAEPLEAGSYALMTYDSHTGTFNPVTDLGAYVTGDGLTYGDHELLLTIDHDLLIGDLDLDGDVDFFDYIGTSNNFGETDGMGFQDGDMDGDGDVDFFDYIAVSNHFGDSLPAAMAPANAASVPEPGTMVLLGMGVVGLLAFALRKRR